MSKNTNFKMHISCFKNLYYVNNIHDVLSNIAVLNKNLKI